VKTRSIEKAISDYKRFAENKGGNTAAFYASDINQIYKRANNPFDWICDALEAGFMIGYRTAKRHEKALAESGR